MKPKLLAIYVFIVCAPLAVVAWLGFSLARNEQKMVSVRFHELLRGKLTDVRTSVTSLIEERERQLVTVQPLASRSPEELRDLAKSSGIVRQYFVLAPDGNLIYPSPISDLTKMEASFIDRTSSIWINGEIPGPEVETEQASAGRGRSKGRAPAPTRSGWYSGYWGSGIEVIFWWREDQSKVVGAELNGARLTADIIGMLPDAWPGMSKDESILPDSRIELADGKGTIIYQWGGLAPGVGQTPQAELALHPPLASWTLRYYAPNASFKVLGGSALFSVLSGVAVLAITLIGLAAYFYRENTRAMREAMQRVTFVNQVSHELKTPLTNIRMYAEMLDDELSESESGHRKRLDVIVSESQRLSRLIGNVLTFSRNQRGLVTLHSTYGIIDDAVQAVVAQFETPFRSRGMRIEFDAHPNEVVLFDRDVLEQILGNLLSNGEKYAASGGIVHVATQQHEGTVTIVVTDNGPGIPHGLREKVFEPFFRISDKLTDGVAGAGFGLTIARELARLHGGDVTLDPTERGACFRVVLCAPLQKQGHTS